MNNKIKFFVCCKFFLSIFFIHFVFRFDWFVHFWIDSIHFWNIDMHNCNFLNAFLMFFDDEKIVINVFINVFLCESCEYNVRVWTIWFFCDFNSKINCHEFENCQNSVVCSIRQRICNRFETLLLYFETKQKMCLLF